MLRTLRSRRRPLYGAQLCAVASALLLLLSVSLLYTRLSSSHHNPDSASLIRPNHLISDTDDTSISDDDKIDVLDTPDTSGSKNDDDEVDGELESEQTQVKRTISSSGYYLDHVTGSIRRALNKKSIDEWDSDYSSFSVELGIEDKAKSVFGSDDVIIDEEVRRKVGEVRGIEDALLLKIGKRVSPLREGWGDWFDKKSDFLRRDRMFKSNLEVLNPLNNPLLQDPDGLGVTGLTRGDKALQKFLLSEFKKTPFLIKKPLTASEDGGRDSGSEHRSEVKRAERRTLDEKKMMQVNNSMEGSNNETVGNSDRSNDSSANGEERQLIDGMEHGEANTQQRKSEELSHVYADGKRWGYFPGLHPHLSFSNFMDSFFRKGKCDMRVFMVWNSPPWMYSVRHQRGLESLLSQHRDACVVVLTETIELDFFIDSFVKEGYKVAVAMPNLDELLKDTPTQIFASVWFEWRKTKFYSTHYSELVRLAALYKYGGIYLDSDIVVLNPLSSLNNTVGLEAQSTENPLNGAVMAFRKNSPFLKECLEEFYMTYDDTKFRWNGADLLTRVARKFKPSKQLELKLQPSNIFFPISVRDITSYFTAPATENEKVQQDAFFRKILSESLTFHFWNSLTSALIPEPGSLAARLINHPCIRCFDEL